MTKETFEELLRAVKLPLGKRLADGKTWRITCRQYYKLPEGPWTCELKNHSALPKFLVMTDGKNVVGGVLFYYIAADFQIQVFDEYQGKGYASAIAHNGVLKKACDCEQSASIALQEIHGWKDYELRAHILNLLGITAENDEKAREKAEFQEWYARHKTVEEARNNLYKKYGKWPDNDEKAKEERTA